MPRSVVLGGTESCRFSVGGRVSRRDCRVGVWWTTRRFVCLRPDAMSICRGAQCSRRVVGLHVGGVSWTCRSQRITWPCPCGRVRCRAGLRLGGVNRGDEMDPAATPRPAQNPESDIAFPLEAADPSVNRCGIDRRYPSASVVVRPDWETRWRRVTIRAVRVRILCPIQSVAASTVLSSAD